MEKQEHSNIAGGNVMMQLLWKTAWQFFKQINIVIIFNFTQKSIPKRIENTYIHKDFTCEYS